MRTAPVPNIPAIPGMNPGVFVLGGGGDGGGAGGRGGGAGKDKQGANGKNGGDSASGGGKGACGSGQNGGACPNHHGKKGSGKGSKGDPVDIVTGRVFTIPVTDVHLPGPLPLTLTRSYTSAARDRDVGLGRGWYHSYAWEVEVHRGRTRLWTGNGMYVDFTPMRVGESAVGPSGWLLVRGQTGFVLDRGDGRWLVFEHAWQDRYLLSAETDSHDNRISFFYKEGVLAQIVDSVGRRVEVRSTREGRIASFEVKNAAHRGQLVPFARYRYDDAGDLVLAEDAMGAATRYTYTDHLLTCQEHPTGLCFYFVYDGAGRCVETWGAYPGREDESLAADVPAVLADGTTAAKGIFHTKLEYGPDNYVEAADSISVERFFGNDFGSIDKAVTAAGVFCRTYDAWGNLLSFTDATGATTRWERDARGRELRITDALGRVTTFERDADGHIRRAVDPAGGVIETGRLTGGLVWRDAIGATFEVHFDRRGLTTRTVAPNGGQTLYRYDDHGNLIERTDPTGAVTQYTYDYWGRRQSMRDASGAMVTYAHDDAGRLRSERTPDGGVTRYEYDPSGNCTSIWHPNGHTTTHRYAGYNRIVETREPDGRIGKYRYNREGRLVEVHNSHGEVHRIRLNAARLVSEEVTFDGRTLRYRYDAMGRVVQFENGLGEKTGYVYDLVGRVVEHQYPDGGVETFEYDELDYIIAAHGPTGDIFFERNLLGWVTCERQVSGGETFSVETKHDLMGNAVERKTSRGHRQTWVRDVAGRALRVTLDGNEELGVVRDALGRETARYLPGGGRVDVVYDGLDRMVQRTVSRGVAGPVVAAGQPDWIGALPHDLTLRQAVHYTPQGDVAAIDDDRSGAERWEHDPRGQVLARTDVHGQGEHFRYDAEGNVRELGAGAPEREYGRGNVLLRRGPVSYVWDGDGRLIKRRVVMPSGQEATTSYEWNGAGLLSAVVRPDGVRIEHVYDPFARRLEKRVLRRDEGGRMDTLSTTRFIWDGDTLVHEIKREWGPEGDRVTQERTYCTDEETSAPWAQKDARSGGDAVSAEWYYYLNDPVGRPERLLDAAGNVACELDRTVWGAARPREGARTETPLRFLGQYYDDETGLAYNRYRYYDPAVGRYISVDPVGLLGGQNGFSYAGNRPTKMVDPMGLMFSTTTGRKDANGNPLPDIQGKSSTVQSDDDLDPALRDAVSNSREKFKDPNKPDSDPRNLDADNKVKPNASSKAGRCAEIDGLNQQAKDIRQRLSKDANGKDCEKWAKMSEAERNARVRNELREEYRRGAKIEAHSKKGKPKNSSEKPCPFCAQVFRELGIHPDNINADPNKDVSDEAKKRAGLTTGDAKGGVMYNGKKWDHKTDGVYDPDRNDPGKNVARENPSATNVVPKLNPDGSQQKNSRDPNAFQDEQGNYRRPDKPPPPPEPKFVPPEDDNTDPTGK
ncbi:RHS repeat-associated core domain-containing protein [Sorangium sp. So ce327]|uniref:RHS repeat-associated core domain-containing protein n=1 Tax=Sorangium sp. So ce327 TaxID=3133301 RepID=UPI003F63B86C